MTTLETEPKIPASVGGCPVEAGVSKVLPQGWDTGSNFCFPIFPSILFFYVLSQAFIKCSRKAFLYIYVYK